MKFERGEFANSIRVLSSEQRRELITGIHDKANRLLKDISTGNSADACLIYEDELDERCFVPIFLHESPSNNLAISYSDWPKGLRGIVYHIDVVFSESDIVNFRLWIESQEPFTDTYNDPSQAEPDLRRIDELLSKGIIVGENERRIAMVSKGSVVGTVAQIKSQRSILHKIFDRFF